MRTRTGCMTCRQRKLKCSEEKPICAQCSKASRTCVPASGITFRHQQNPSMNKNQESLRSFYGYKETFAKAARWVPVSKDLTWVHTSNPYEDNDDEEREQQRRASGFAMNQPSRESDGNDISQADYATFTEGLAALSAVASQDQFAQSLATMQQAPTQNTQPGTSHQQLEYVLNTESRMPNSDHQLDPQLQMLESGPVHESSYIRVQSPPAPKEAQP